MGVTASPDELVVGQFEIWRLPDSTTLGIVGSGGDMVDDRAERRFEFKMPRSAANAGTFAWQILVATFVVVALAAGAAAVNWVIELFVAYHAPAWIIFCLQALEVLLMAIDVVCMTTMMVREAIDFCVMVWTKKRD